MGILRTTGRAAAVVAAVVALLGVLSVLGLLDRVAWVFLLAGVFRLQYIVVLCGAALLALALGRIRLASIAAALAALNMVAIGVPLTAPATAAHGPTTGSLRLLIANVEVGNHRAGAVERLIERVQPDVVGIVELTPEMAGRLGRSLPGYRMRRIVPRDDAYGIGLYSRVPLDSARVARFPSDGGPPTVIARARLRASRSPWSSHTCTRPSPAPSTSGTSRRSGTHDLPSAGTSRSAGTSTRFPGRDRFVGWRPTRG